MVDVSNFTSLITSSPIVNQPAHFLTARVTESDLNADRALIQRVREEVTANPARLPYTGQVNRVV